MRTAVISQPLSKFRKFTFVVSHSVPFIVFFLKWETNKIFKFLWENVEGVDFQGGRPNHPWMKL